MKKGYSVENFEEIFLNANYILFDPSLWIEAHSELKQLNVQYHLIGLDYFSYESDTPTLININRRNIQNYRPYKKFIFTAIRKNPC